MELCGVQLHYDTYGLHGSPVVCLHGWGCKGDFFAPIANALSAEHTVYTLDLPAHGQSSRPPEPWGVPEYARCVAAFMRQLNLPACDLIAHSFGGRIALYLAANMPDTVNRMVLTGCAGLRGEETEEQKKRRMRFSRGKALAQKLINLGGPLKTAGEKAISALQQKYGSPDYNALDDEMKKTFVKIVSQDLTPLLGDIRASTLLIWGENDTETPLWMARKMESTIADCALVVFDGQDHFAFLKEWQRFASIAKVFFQ